MGATERQSLEDALARLPELERKLAVLLDRIREFVPLEPGARVLDIGAAQGVFVAALERAGFEGEGVEPWDEAVKASREVAERTSTRFELTQGTAETLPFPDGSFDFVHAQSVMEHVDDPQVAFNEASRVLRPGGVFFFYSTNALCPRQSEIRRFPAFAWYPGPLKRRIMDWAMAKRPDLVGHTEKPAYTWWTPRKVKRTAEAAGFSRVIDRWQMKRPEELDGAAQRVFAALQSKVVARRFADVMVRESSYLLIK